MQNGGCDDREGEREREREGEREGREILETPYLRSPSHSPLPPSLPPSPLVAGKSTVHHISFELFAEANGDSEFHALQKCTLPLSSASASSTNNQRTTLQSQRRHRNIVEFRLNISGIENDQIYQTNYQPTESKCCKYSNRSLCGEILFPSFPFFCPCLSLSL